MGVNKFGAHWRSLKHLRLVEVRQDENGGFRPPKDIREKKEGGEYFAKCAKREGRSSGLAYRDFTRRYGEAEAAEVDGFLRSDFLVPEAARPLATSGTRAAPYFHTL